MPQRGNATRECISGCHTVIDINPYALIGAILAFILLVWWSWQYIEAKGGGFNTFRK